jgi:deazaflavin-dependent oxidoreductase (nitroreductase family)
MFKTRTGTLAVREQTVRTPPRFVVRTFWLLHRALYRISGGRVGLSRPEAGEKFGMMRLNTLGRHSGEPRAAIVGYYEDGPNLVTLAMNGWGRSEPAWWLNLQANPDATVDLADGPRVMRARTATGTERERLWVKFREYPGWGDDIDARAAHRSTSTTVVVFEPRDGGLGASAAATTRTPSANVGRPRRLTLRHLLIVPGIGLALFASVQANAHGVGLVPLLVFGIVPHLTVALGIGQPHARGQLAPRAVPIFNAMHHPALPLAVLGLAVANVLPPFWLVGALAWLGHIVVDWAKGDGLRDADGYVLDRSIWNARPFGLPRAAVGSTITSGVHPVALASISFDAS